MTEGLWLVLALGAILGFYIGRWWSEVQRGRSDMRRMWNARRDGRR
jgi:hypothetical protein